MSVFALLASLAFWFTRDPRVLDYESHDHLVLQASHLSNVHEYFNTTRSEIQSNVGSFKANFIKNTEIQNKKSSSRTNEKKELFSSDREQE